MKNRHFFYRLQFALAGIYASWKSEKSFRLHVAATLAVIIILSIAHAPAIWWAILLLTCGLVMTLELINTAIEKFADHLHPDQHIILKVVKDTLAGAVLLASIIAVCIFIAFLWTII